MERKKRGGGGGGGSGSNEPDEQDGVLLIELVALTARLKRDGLADSIPEVDLAVEYIGPRRRI